MVEGYITSIDFKFLFEPLTHRKDEDDAESSCTR